MHLRFAPIRRSLAFLVAGFACAAFAPGLLAQANQGGSAPPAPSGGGGPSNGPAPKGGPPKDTVGNDASKYDKEEKGALAPTPPPSVIKALRRGAARGGHTPPAGPKGPRSTGEDDGRGLYGPRAWESWWELHRDRFVRNAARDVSVEIGRVPADPRTRVQPIASRVGSFERIEPSLRVLINHERSEVVLARALMALAKLGEDPRVPGARATYATILPYVHHADSQLREAAITALGILGTEDALFPLGEIAAGTRPAARAKPAASRFELEASADANARQRALALYAMGLIGRDSGKEDVRRLAASRICALFTQDESAEPEVQFAALHALSLIPIRCEPAEVAPDAKPARGSSARRAAKLPRAPAKSIPAASRAAEVDWVLSVLDDEAVEGWIRAQAVTAAARLCSELEDGSAMERKVVERILAALADRSKDPLEIRQSAALALGELGDADKDEQDAGVRAALALALEESSDQSTREFALLSLALVGSRPGGRAGEADRLAGSDDVRSLLLQRAATARASERPWAALALGLFERGMQDAGVAGSTASRQALAGLLAETRSAEVAAACSLALGLARGAEGKAQLIARLRDGDVAVRSYAALALGMLGARDAAPALERLLAEARHAPELYRSASEALQMLGAPVSRQLLGMMAAGASLESQMVLCSTMGRVGDASTLRALSQAACDAEGLVWVRAAATSALGTLGARRPDWNADLGHALNFLDVPPTLLAPSLDGLLDLE